MPNEIPQIKPFKDIKEAVPWGRTYLEYLKMFCIERIDEALLKKGILDIAGGPSGFCADMNEAGYRTFSLDPFHELDKGEKEKLFKEIRQIVRKSLLEDYELGEESKFNWAKFGDPEKIITAREEAMKRYMDDFAENKRSYLAGGLPDLPFEDRSLGLALCSHFLFLYSDSLNLDFHINSIKEMCRVAEEVRIFPLVNLDGERSKYLTLLLKTLQNDGYQTEVVGTDYEFYKGGNEMLIIKRPQDL